MSEDRPFPPTPRRLALARRAGLTPASPLLVGAAACGAAVLALGFVGRAFTERLSTQIASSSAMGDVSFTRDGAADRDGEITRSLTGALRDAVSTAGELVLPLLAAIAVAALAAHFAQTRSVWLPRRRVEDAPALDFGAAARTRRASLELVHALAIGGVAVGWLWWAAPRIAALPTVPLAAAALVLSALAAIAIAWLAIGTLDALLRHAAVGRALRMTARERREDDRMSAADPRWRQLARKLAREPDARTQLAEATLLLLGDDTAVAIAFDPLRRPIPTRVAVGKGVRATQLLAIARRYRIAIHREPTLAAALAGTTGPVPEAQWSRLADLVAASRR